MWVKLSLCRNSQRFPDYPDIRVFHDSLIAANPSRLLWGSDWPHVRMGELTPDVGHLVDLFHDWTNDRAIEPQSQAAYVRFGLNARQIELVSRATPKRQYYLQSARGNRLFELGLGPIALALCGASDPENQKRIDRILSDIDLLRDGWCDEQEFARRFLADAGLEWATDLLVDFPDPSPPEGENP